MYQRISMIILKKRKKKVAKKKPESVSAQWYQFATPEFGKTSTANADPQTLTKYE